MFIFNKIIEKFFINYEKTQINNHQMDLIINSIFILAYKFIDTDSDYYICYISFKMFFSKGKKIFREKRFKGLLCILLTLENNLNKFTIFINEKKIKFGYDVSFYINEIGNYTLDIYSNKRPYGYLLLIVSFKINYQEAPTDNWKWLIMNNFLIFRPLL